MRSIEVKISELEIHPDNVRKSFTKSGIEEMKASILAHGLMQNLVVVQKGNKYQVIAGSRRLTALRELEKEGKLDKESAIRCIVATSDNAQELSLAENTAREQMHPADEYKAFAALINDKCTIEDIALRFGCTKKHVQERLRLGRVAPEIMKAFVDGKLDLDCLKTYTLTEDQKLQLSVFKSLKGSNSEHAIKRMIINDMPSADSKIAKFVGQKEYEKAGGTVRADLFSEDVFFENPKLLEELAKKKVDAKLEALKKQGFAEVNYSEEYKQFSSGYEPIYETPKKADFAKCMVNVRIEYNGEFDIDYYRIGKSAAAAKKAKASGGLSQALIDDLASQRMEIVRLGVARDPNIALTALSFHLVSSVVSRFSSDYQGYAEYFSDISTPIPTPTKKIGEANETAWKKKTPNHPHAEMIALLTNMNKDWRKGKTQADKFRDFCKLDFSTRAEMLAICFAMTLKPQVFGHKAGCSYDAMTELLTIEACKYWRPDSDYFERLKSDQLLAIISEIWGKDYAAKQKGTKKTLVHFLSTAFKMPEKYSPNDAELRNRLETWLPSQMRLKAPSELPNAKSKKVA